MAEQSIGRPLAKAHLARVLGLDPRRGLGFRDLLARPRLGGALKERSETGRVLSNDGVEQRLELAEQVVAEPRSDAAGIDEPSVHHIGEL